MTGDELLSYAETELNFYLNPNQDKAAMLGRLYSLGVRIDG